MFSRLKQKLKEESLNILNDQPSKLQNQPDVLKEQLIAEEKLCEINNTREDTIKYQTSSSDETNTSESIKSSDSTPLSDLKTNDLLTNYDIITKQQQNEPENIEEYHQINSNLRTQIDFLNVKSFKIKILYKQILNSFFDLFGLIAHSHLFSLKTENFCPLVA